MSAPRDVTVHSVPFLIDETPFALWSLDPQQENLRFLDGIRPGYFSFLARLHGAVLHTQGETPAGEDRQYAATALRNAYAQGLETLFALLGAALQAPDAPAGYVLKYRDELPSVVRKISGGGDLKTMFRLGALSWQAVAELTVPDLGDADRRRMNVAGFARVWSLLAQDYLSERRSQEHNSIKHGLRVRMGGFQLAIGLPGEGDPAEAVHPIGGSEFGASFAVPARLMDDRLNLYLHEVSTNWNIEQMVYGLELITFSIRNILAFLKLHLGADPATLEVFLANDPAAFEFPRTPQVGVSSFAHTPTLQVEPGALLTRAQVMAWYDDAPEDDRPSVT